MTRICGIILFIAALMVIAACNSRDAHVPQNGAQHKKDSTINLGNAINKIDIKPEVENNNNTNEIENLTVKKTLVKKVETPTKVYYDELERLSPKDSLQILFIGNSFTVLNNEPTLFKCMTSEACLPAHVESFTHLGMGVNFWMTDTGCWKKIKSRSWDYVVFQDLQSYYYEAFGTYPKGVFSNNLKFQDSIKKLNPCCKIIYVAGWEQQGGLPARFPGDNTDQLIDRILNNYTYLNSQTNVHNSIAPVGVAWKRSFHKRPDLVLVSDDNRHPSKYGSYLYASVMFATIFKQNPTDLTYSWILPEQNTRFLREVAYQAVIDTLPFTNLESISIPYTRKKSLLKAKCGYSNYQWYKNNYIIPGANYDSLIVKDTTAFYSLSAKNETGCSLISLAQYYPKPCIDPLQLAKFGINIYSNPGRGNLTIEFKQATNGPVQVHIFTPNGKMICKLDYESIESQRINLDLDNLPSGIYIAEIIAKKNVARKKILIQ